jgi:hypothetical protein
MNFIEKLATIKSDCSNLVSVMNEIKKYLSNSKKDVLIAGKTLRNANVEQPALYGLYDEIRVHLKYISERIEIQILRRKAQVLKYISEESQLDYGERIREKLVDDDPEYVELRIRKLEVDEVLDLASSICRQFEQRGYTLNNITKSIVAQAQDEHIVLD